MAERPEQEMATKNVWLISEVNNVCVMKEQWSTVYTNVPIHGTFN